MPLLLAALVLLVVARTVLLTGGRERGDLDPRAADPSGSRALAELLRRQRVDVTLVTDSRLREAGVDVTAVRVGGMVHDFLMLDSLRDTRAANVARHLAIEALSTALHDR